MPAVSTTAAMRKVMFTMPPDLLHQLDDAAIQLEVNRSQLIRHAIQLYLDEQQRQAMEAQLTEGYRIHAARDQQISEAFRYTDAEVDANYLVNDDLEDGEW